MPVALANGIFADSIKKSQAQPKIDPNYRLLVEYYYKSYDTNIKKLFCTQMSELRLKESNVDIQQYLFWFEENIDKLDYKDFGNFELYKASKELVV